MRSSASGLIVNGFRLIPEETVLEVFRRICLTRYFEEGLIGAVKAGFVTSPVYLSMGQESVAAALSCALSGYSIFAQHRCHATYLSFGGSPRALRDELLGLESGTSGGKAGSNCIQCHEETVTMHGHHGLIGENVALAVGGALGSGQNTLTLFGDGAAEEDYVLSALGFAATHRLPVFFICEDNNLSILTAISTRRSWFITEVADAFGIKALDMADDPWTVYLRARELSGNLPAFMNVYTCRANWHVGVGTDGPTEWDRFALIRNDLERLGLSSKAAMIQDRIRGEMEGLWDLGQLPTPSGR